MRTPLTGRRVAMIFVGGFGIVIAVNFYMAWLAVGGFSGVVVENSYVASQKFNIWLEQAAAKDALGWEADVTRDDSGRMVVTTKGVADSARISATVRRPLGEHETAELSFINAGDGRFVSSAPLADGRWIVRLNIQSDDQLWADETYIQ